MIAALSTEGAGRTRSLQNQCAFLSAPPPPRTTGNTLTNTAVTLQTLAGCITAVQRVTNYWF